MANKIKYGLKNVHYAKLTEGEADTYAVPVAIPGAVNLSLSPVGDSTSFVADDTEYYTAQGNNGYDGTLEMADIPEAFRTGIMGEVEDAKKVLFEKSSANSAPFALLFEFTGDAHQVKHVLYKCTATRANVEGAATVNKEIKTTTLNLQVRPNRGGYVKANTKSDTDSATAAAWYTAVQTFDSEA
ncbi:MAG: major tail protein [Bacillota bacterium]